MRVDLTIRDQSGKERDVAVLCRDQACLEELRSADPGLVCGEAWVGHHRLPDDTPIGSPLLCTGTVVAVGHASLDEIPAHDPVSLRVVGGRGAGTSVVLRPGSVTIGRAPTCDVVLADPDVSRRHAEVVVSAHGLTLRDLGSTNGTWLDGERVGADGVLLGPGGLVRVGDSFLTVSAAAEPLAAVVVGPDGTRLVNRAPRLPAGPVSREILVPERPRVGGPQRVQWMAALLPALLGAVLALTMRSPLFLAFALLSPAILLATALGDRVHWRRNRRRAAATFSRRSAAAQAEIAAGLADELAARRDQYPDPAAMLAIARGPGARLWERGPNAHDAWTVRLGLADQYSHLRVRREGAAEAGGLLDDVPLVADLREGPLGIAAPSGLGTSLARWVVAQLAGLHSPADLEIALLLSDAAAVEWHWARWLPHVRGRIAATAQERRTLVSDLAELVARRTAERSRHSLGPQLLLVLDRASGVSDLPGIGEVLASGSAAGVLAVCVDTAAQRLPAACIAVAQSYGETGARLRLRRHDGTAPPRHDVSDSFADVDPVADLVSVGWAESLARTLAPLADAGAINANIPDSCRLLDVLGLEELDPESVLERWSRSRGGADTLLGLDGDGAVRIDLIQDGPHALVAGTTGAGKSELLQSWIAGLAASHPPDELSFVLVDYKGGAAFGECARLPHTTGLVTDLDAHLTARALRSLDAELRRREELFASVGAKDLAHYRAAGGSEPLARLVLVVDEFAALADELPDFVSGLVGIAQRGRSLGIHLVLATQRPGGVVSPEIRANTALRVALRVTDAAESVDVVDCDAAADLDPHQPGRAYVRSGPTLRQVQVARVGGPARLDGRSGALRVETLDEWRRIRPTHARDQDKTDLHLLADCISEATNRSGRQLPRRPWLSALPTHVAVSDLGAGPAGSSVRFGLVDLPAKQAQVPLALDLATAGSLLVAGGARSGRSSTLVTIALQAAARLSPQQLHIHAIDFGAALDVLAPLPHCGTLVGRDNPDLVTTLINRLEHEIVRRQRTFAENGLTRIVDAWRNGYPMPAVLLLLDGWDNFLANFDEHDLGRTAQQFVGLLRSAASAGITIAVAGDRGALAPRLAGAISSKLILRLTERSDFAMAGIPTAFIPRLMPPGRALRAEDGAEIQLAHVGRAASREEQQRIASAVASRWSNQGDTSSTSSAHVGAAAAAIRLRPLPARVSLSDMPPQPGRMVLGAAGDEAAPLAFDPFAGAGRLLVAGPPRSGRTTVLRSLLQQSTAARLQVVVAASRRSPLATDADRAGLLRLSADAGALTAPLPSGPTLLLVDDAETLLDSALGDALESECRLREDLAVIAAGRTDDLVVTFRGLAAQVRRARCCLILQPGPADGELVGQRLPRHRASGIPGRGLLVGDPAWGAEFGTAPIPIQVALP